MGRKAEELRKLAIKNFEKAANEKDPDKATVYQLVAEEHLRRARESDV